MKGSHLIYKLTHNEHKHLALHRLCEAAKRLAAAIQDIDTDTNYY